MSLADMRNEYGETPLNEASVERDPVKQFAAWFADALEARSVEWFEPNAMTVATCTPDGVPSARVLLLKDFGERGFSFFTNYDSRKSRELAANPRASMVFYWAPLARQVRIEGTITKLSREESLAYHRTRPRASQLGATISRQSDVIANRQELESRMREVEAHYAGQDVPLPDNWGGYLLTPLQFEFWQGRASRLHDRLRYTRRGGAWLIERLSP